MADKHLRKTRNTNGHEYVEVWHTTPPQADQRYRVLRDEWVTGKNDGQPDERHIHQIDLAERAAT